MDSCLQVGSTENDPGYPVREHFAEQRVIEYFEADYGGSAVAVEDSAAAAATAVEEVLIVIKKRPQSTHTSRK